MNARNTNTTTVWVPICFLVGHTTFFSSPLPSRMNRTSLANSDSRWRALALRLGVGADFPSVFPVPAALFLLPAEALPCGTERLPELEPSDSPDDSDVRPEERFLRRAEAVTGREEASSFFSWSFSPSSLTSHSSGPAVRQLSSATVSTAHTL